jgi:SpoU rRNA methylase family enzyme
MDQQLVDAALARLRAIRDEVPEEWERIVVDLGISAISKEGLDAVSNLQTLLRMHGYGNEVLSLNDLTDQVGKKLSLRDASNLLAVLEANEANRLVRSQELLQKVWVVVVQVAGELLKLALKGA